MDIDFSELIKQAYEDSLDICKFITKEENVSELYKHIIAFSCEVTANALLRYHIKLMQFLKENGIDINET